MVKIKRLLAVDDKPRTKSNFAQIASAFVAIIALAGIYVQVSLARQNALLASTRQVYLSLSQASLQHPRLAKPNYQQLKSAPDQKELIRYQIYVSNMITTYDEIFQTINDREWLAGFHYDIKYQLPYLCEQNDPAYYRQFYKETRQLIAKEKTKFCPHIPALLELSPPPTYPQ